MNERKLVRETKAMIAEVEGGQTDRAAWTAIQDRIKRLKENRTFQQVGDLLDKSNQWVSDVYRWDSRDTGKPTPWAGPRGEKRERSTAQKVLRDPEQRRRALAELPAAEVEAVIEDANEVAMDRVRAKRSEHQTQPTTRDLMGSDPFHPDEFWADNVIIRINRNARELASLIQRGGGLILGAMEVDRAFDYLNEAEQLIAEARAAAQEQSRDKAGVS